MDLTNMTSEELLSLRAAVSGELARRARENGVVLTDDERDLIRSGEHVRACKMVRNRIKPDGLGLRDAWRAVTAERERVEGR